MTKAKRTTRTHKPGWSAKEIADMPIYLRIETMNSHRRCPKCGRYIDNRNHGRHVKACAVTEAGR